MTVLRIRPLIVRKDQLVLRLMSELLFTIQALPHLWRQRPDLIMASSPYMFLGPLGWLISRLRGTPFVWDVRDLTWLYPRSAGKRTFGLDRLLDKLMRFVAARASALLTATQGLHAYFEQRPKVSAVIPNGVDDAWLEDLLRIGPVDRNAPPCVVYAGLLGYNHDLSTVVRAAAALRDIRFLMVGDGPELPRLRELATSLGAGNVEFRGHLAQDELLEVYTQASVLVSHVRASPVNRWTQPAKVWEYLATGRPVVHAGEGEVIEILEAGRLSLTVLPGHPDQLAAAIRSLLEDPDGADEFGARGRIFTSTERRRSLLNQDLVNVVHQVFGA